MTWPIPSAELAQLQSFLLVARATAQFASIPKNEFLYYAKRVEGKLNKNLLSCPFFCQIWKYFFLELTHQISPEFLTLIFTLLNVFSRFVHFFNILDSLCSIEMIRIRDYITTMEMMTIDVIKSRRRRSNTDWYYRSNFTYLIDKLKTKSRSMQ